MKHLIRFIILAVILFITACSVKHHDVIQNKSHIDYAYFDAKHQKEILNEVIKDNKYTTYMYDSEQYDRNITYGSNIDDSWNIDRYQEIEDLKQKIRSGIKSALNETVYVDCDDTMLHMVMALLDKHYPADQIYMNYYLVPENSAELTGTQEEFAGHAVATVDVVGDIPVALEDIEFLRYQRDIEDLGYYCVLWSRLDRDLRRNWYFVDFYGYQQLVKGEITLEEAKKRPNYIKHQIYLNTIFKRDEK